MLRKIFEKLRWRKRELPALDVGKFGRRVPPSPEIIGIWRGLLPKCKKYTTTLQVRSLDAKDYDKTKKRPPRKEHPACTHEIYLGVRDLGAGSHQRVFYAQFDWRIPHAHTAVTAFQIGAFLASMLDGMSCEQLCGQAKGFDSDYWAELICQEFGWRLRSKLRDLNLSEASWQLDRARILKKFPPKLKADKPRPPHGKRAN